MRLRRRRPASIFACCLLSKANPPLPCGSQAASGGAALWYGTEQTGLIQFELGAQKAHWWPRISTAPQSGFVVRVWHFWTLKKGRPAQSFFGGILSIQLYYRFKDVPFVRVERKAIYVCVALASHTQVKTRGDFNNTRGERKKKKKGRDIPWVDGLNTHTISLVHCLFLNIFVVCVVIAVSKKKKNICPRFVAAKGT